ncbi:MAG: DNA repair protein RadA [Gammaproteobacteria bacterium]
MRAKFAYQCQGCGALASKWAGQCGDCSAWNTLVEIAYSERPDAAKTGGYSAEPPRARMIEAISPAAEAGIPSGMGELDRVLGGSIVAGAVVLIGGDPGIGKSTLLLQMLAAAKCSGLYVSGEESAQQVALRSRRLGIDAACIKLLTETRLESILGVAAQEAPRVMIIDSIQTVFTEALPSAPGSVGQVRESAAQLIRFAKNSGASVFLVGHVTKEGVIAGPRVLEHMVDTVLYFEGDDSSRFRILRSTKNRYGPVHELGIFAMTEGGLRPVTNPSAIFLQRHVQGAAGSVVMVCRQGSRPLLIEVQALVDQSFLANPRRVAVGLDPNRLAMLLAVLHRHGGIVTHDQDVFINVVGGIRVTETGADLAVTLAVLSSLRGRPLPADMVVFGEVGLSGELRPVPNGSERLHEAVKHGFRRALVPKANAPRREMAGLEVTAPERLEAALASI